MAQYETKVIFKMVAEIIALSKSLENEGLQFPTYDTLCTLETLAARAARNGSFRVFSPKVAWY